MLTFRWAAEADFPAIWRIFREITLAGDTYVEDESCTEQDAQRMWFGPQTITMLACEDEQVLGAYKILPNRPGRGKHVANGSYIVDAAIRGRGLGRQMVLHSLETARRAGYHAIQFNFVVATNTGAVKLYEDLGFRIIGTQLQAFNHKALGYVDAYVMHRFLTDDPQ